MGRRDAGLSEREMRHLMLMARGMGVPPMMVRHLPPPPKYPSVWPIIIFCVGVSVTQSFLWWRLDGPMGLEWAFFRTFVSTAMGYVAVKLRWRHWRKHVVQPTADQLSAEMIRRWADANAASARWN